jgi:hypothetical protein
LRRYVSQNREEVLGIRVRVKELLSSMSGSDLTALQEKNKKERKEIDARADNLLRTFDDSSTLLRILRLVY